MDFQTWLQIQLNWRDEPVLWLLGSFLLYVLACNVAWILGRERSGRLGRAVGRLHAWPGSRWLVLLLRWAYFVGPPYAMLLLGVISPRWMGLGEVDWVHSAGTGGAVAAAALGLLSLSWWSYRRGRPVQQSDIGVPFVPRPLRWLLVLMETAALQAHWAFYRSGFITQTWLDDPYWGSWAGWALVCLEWALNPWLRHGLRQPDEAEPILRRTVLALVTTTLFILTRNVWLCWALHALFEAWAEHGSFSTGHFFPET